MPIAVQKTQEKLGRNSMLWALVLFLILGSVGTGLYLNSRNPATDTPAPTPTIQESAYYFCAKYSYEPYFYPDANLHYRIENWNPIPYPLPQPPAVAVGNTLYEVELHVDYTMAVVEKSPISEKDVVTRTPVYDQIYKCVVRYTGIEDGIKYFVLESLKRKQ